MSKEKKVMDALEKAGDEMGFEVGKPLTVSEFLELFTSMQKAYKKSNNWDDAGKAFGDFYQKKNRKDKSITHSEENSK